MQNSVSATTLADELATFQVVDVRRRPAFDASPGLIPTAIWRSPAEVTQWQMDLDPARPSVVYCVHGHEVSQECARFLQANGFNASYLEGGFEQWMSEGRAISTRQSFKHPS